MSALPSDLVYQPGGRPAAVPSSRYRLNSVPSNGSTFAASGQTCRVELGGGGRYGTFLLPNETYLKFKINNGHDVAINLDGDASCVIKRLELYHGSSLISSCSDYSTLSALLRQVNNDPNMSSKVGSLTFGNNDAIAANGSQTFMIPLLEPVIGLLASKACPIGQMTAADLRVEITFHNSATAFVCSTNPGSSVTFSDINLVTTMLELPPDVMNMIVQGAGGMFTISTQIYQQAESTSPATTTKDAILLPVKGSSVKSLVTTFKKAGDYTLSTAKSITGRYNPLQETGQYFHRLVGGQNLPQTPIGAAGGASREAYMESVLKGFGLSHHTRASNEIDSTNWLAQDDSGRFFINFNSEHFPNHGENFEGGVSTISAGNSFLNITYSAGLPTGGCLVSSFFHMDAILSVDPSGLATIAY